MQLGVIVAVYGALAAKACLGRAIDEPHEDGIQISLEDPSREEDVVLLNVNTDDRLDYKITNDDGSYQYGYQTGRLQGGGHSYKHEYRRPDGVLFGQHGHETASGVLTSTNYVADARGYRVLQEGQKYEPVSADQLHLRRSDSNDHSRRFHLKHRDLVKMGDVEKIEMESDTDTMLAANEIPPHWFHDPDTGAYRFLYRSVSDPDTVAYRSETRRKDGVIFGQFGHRSGQAQPSNLVSFVSDALGYRVVDPGRGPVPILSEAAALRLQREGRRAVKSEITSSFRTQPSAKTFSPSKDRDINRNEVISSVEEESSGYPPEHASDDKEIQNQKHVDSRFDQNEDILRVNNVYDGTSLDAEPGDSAREIEKHLDNNIRSTAIKSSLEDDRDYDDDHTDDRDTSDDERDNDDDDRLVDEKDTTKDEKDQIDNEENTTDYDKDITDNVKDTPENENPTDNVSKRPEDDNHSDEDYALPSIGDDSEESASLDSVVVEAASSIPQFSPPESSDVDSEDHERVSTTPILQLLARYPPVVMTPEEALQHPEKVPSLIPYGAVKQVIPDTYVASDHADTEGISSRSGSATLNPEGHAIVKYQSLPYALVPLSLLPIRTYKVVQPASRLPPSVHIRSY